MKHTPGTWITKDGQVYPEETGKTIAVIPYYDEENSRQKADAALLAAAPDMLQACETAVAQIYNNDPQAAIATLQNAAKKAKGE